MSKCIKCKEKEAVKIKKDGKFTFCKSCYEKERVKQQQFSTYDDMRLLAEEIKEFDFYIDVSEGKLTKITDTTKGIRKAENKLNLSF